MKSNSISMKNNKKWDYQNKWNNRWKKCKNFRILQISIKLKKSVNRISTNKWKDWRKLKILIKH